MCLAVLACVSAKSIIEGPRRALVVIQGDDVNGKIMLEQASISSPVKIRGVIYGMEPGLHSLHVHSGKSLGVQCENVGAPFLPVERRESERPAGLLGNVKVYKNDQKTMRKKLITYLPFFVPSIDLLGCSFPYRRQLDFLADFPVRG